MNNIHLDTQQGEPSASENYRRRHRFLSQWSDLLQAFARNKLALLGAILLVIILALAITAPWIAPHDPLKQHLKLTLMPPVWRDEGNPAYLFGTDHLGRDILSRLLYGARISLPTSVAAATLALLVGVSIGLISGYYGGKTDMLLTGLVDIFLAFPLILVAISLAAILGPSQRNLVIVMVLTGWMNYARVIRSAVLSTKTREFITAAILIGAKNHRVIMRHVFPNVVAPMLVLFAYNVSQFIILESALSFLGLGIPPPTPTWGRMLFEGRMYLTVAPWIITFPGICIMLAVLSFNFIGDGLRDALDPNLRRLA